MKTGFISAAVLLLVSLTYSELDACTTGLAGSKATLNGHVLLWKNRDSGFIDNELVFFKYHDFKFIGLINRNDTTQVWAGVNNYGFAIMNAESRDMALPGEPTEYDGEGYLMKAALKQCKTVDDFENMLQKSNAGGRKVTSNFGVIDASGCAAFFETGNHEYIRCDASASSLDFLIRANFAYNARSSEGYGRVRHDRALNLVKEAIQNNSLDHRFIISTVSTDTDLPDSLIDPNRPNYQKTRDTVNRYRSVAAAVFDYGINPEMTTFWCALGEPACSVAIPLWVAAGKVPGALDTPNGSPLNSLFQEIKRELYIDKTHLDLNKLAQVRPILDKSRKKIFRLTERQSSKWVKSPPTAGEIALFQEKMVGIATKSAEKALRKLQSGPAN